MIPCSDDMICGIKIESCTITLEQHRSVLLLYTIRAFILWAVCCVVLCCVRFTRVSSIRSSGRVSRTVFLWTRDSCHRSCGTPVITHTWWANGTWACSRETVCPHAEAFRRFLVGPLISNSSESLTLSNCCCLVKFVFFEIRLLICRLPDGFRRLLHPSQMLFHLSSEHHPLRSGPAGR